MMSLNHSMTMADSHGKSIVNDIWSISENQDDSVIETETNEERNDWQNKEMEELMLKSN